MRVLGSTGRGPNRRANGRSRNIPCPPLERPSPSARQNRSAPSARRRGKQPPLRQNHANAKGLESGGREREAHRRPASMVRHKPSNLLSVIRYGVSGGF